MFSKNGLPALCGTVALFTLAAGGASAQQATSRVTLDSLLNTQIHAASKYLQTSADAPASITIVTADDIRQHRYRNLQEVLENVRGFYVSNDRNYPYLGMRGFSRPTDYNNRILLLIDGHALNDQTWGGTPVGSDLPVNFDAIERIEVVRGPGSALYGTNAMFGVINIVTKTGAQLNGIRASVAAGSGDSREATIAAGSTLGVRSSFAASAIVARSEGGQLRFPDLVSETSDGVSRNQDWEESYGLLGAFTAGSFGARGGVRSRSKGIPTGAYGTTLGDERAMTSDKALWGEISLRHESAGSLDLGLRLYADKYEYRGVYPSTPGPAYSDGGGSTDVGAEILGTWDPVSRSRLTFGTEYRHVTRANYVEMQRTGERTSDNAPFSLVSLFAENALRLHSLVDVVAGVRFEGTSRQRNVVAPRLAFLLTPAPHTTLKLLYGQAYRTPAAAESELSTSYYTRNPSLRAERISVSEIEFQQHLLSPLLLTATVFHYRLRDLIDQVESEEAGVSFRNRARARAAGVEVQADVRPEAPVAATATYSFQRARDEEADTDLTNSPRHLATVSFRTGHTRGLTTATTVRYEAGRKTLLNSRTPSFVRTDFAVTYAWSGNRLPLWAQEAALSLRVTNVFDAVYATPGGFEHHQASIPQAGRMLTVRVDWSR